MNLLELARPATQSVTPVSPCVVRTAEPAPPATRATIITAYDWVIAIATPEPSIRVSAIAMARRSPSRPASMPPGSARNTPGNMNTPVSTPISA